MMNTKLTGLRLRTACCLAIALTVTGLARGQKLRRGFEGADAVVVARCVRVQPFKGLVLHRLRIEHVVKGQALLRDAQGKAVQQITIPQPKRTSQHARPTPQQRRLYCLHDFQRRARQAKLPVSFAPYFKMNAFPGANPQIADLDKDPAIKLVRILADAEAGHAPRKIADRLHDMAIGSTGSIRIEAAELLAERQSLLDSLTEVHMRAILNRAIGEQKDIPYKVALASVCGCKRTPGLVASLCVCLRDTADPRFLQALGRITRHLHREDSAKVLLPHIRNAKQATRARLIYVMGATSTESGLKALVALRPIEKDKNCVDAALRVHSPRGVKLVKQLRTAKPGKKQQPAERSK